MFTLARLNIATHGGPALQYVCVIVPLDLLCTGLPHTDSAVDQDVGEPAEFWLLKFLPSTCALVSSNLNLGG